MSGEIVAAIVGGLVGSAIPVLLGGITFAVAWGKVTNKIDTAMGQISKIFDLIRPVEAQKATLEEHSGRMDRHDEDIRELRAQIAPQGD